MTESSRFWNTSGVGDGAGSGYARAAISSFFAALFLRKGLANGVLRGVLSELAVTGSASPLTVAPGAAIVDGATYENDTNLAVTVSTPGVGTTGGRIVLRADWAAQTVRCISKLNTAGNSAPPALTQTSGTTYELGLYTFTITTGGAIANLTRSPALPAGYAKIASAFTADMLSLAGQGVVGNPGASAAAAQLITGSGDGVLRRSGTSFGFGEVIEAMLASGAVDLAALGTGSIDDSKLGDRVPQLLRRQGGGTVNWGTAGTTDHTPGAVRMMVGAYRIYWTNSEYTYTFSLTLPSGIFSGTPLVLSTINTTNIEMFTLYLRALSSTSLSGALRRYQTDSAVGVTINWLAIGPAA